MYGFIYCFDTFAKNCLMTHFEEKYVNPFTDYGSKNFLVRNQIKSC
jgi:hypothetical protein